MDWHLERYLAEMDRLYWNAIRDEMHEINQRLAEAASAQERDYLCERLNDLTAELFVEVF